MQRILLWLVVAISYPCVVVAAEELIPTADGTTWRYEMSEQAGPAFSFSRIPSGAVRQIHRLTTYRISGTQDFNARTFLKFEVHRDGMITNTDLMTVNDQGIFCAARIDQFGRITALDPPQPIVAMPLESGARWEFTSTAGDSKVRQRYEVLGEEDVDLAAGAFRAVHIRGEQAAPVSMTIDRWFVPGIGIIKDVTTTKTAEGELLRRISLELKERPKVTPRLEVKALIPPKKISITVGKSPFGEAASQFAANTLEIHARWQGRDLPVGAKIRVVWVAENVADVAPPDYIIDEATAVAHSPDAHGTFTLSRPDDGWALGDYRVDIFVDAELIDSAKVTITK